MWSNIKNWLKKFGGLALAFVGIVAFLANATAVFNFAEERLATPTPPPTAIPTDTHIPTDTPIPTVSPTPTLGPFQFVSLPTQARAGTDVEVILQARKDDVCVLEYYTPDGSQSAADGLGTVTVNSLARCVWKWHISANTNPGLGKLVMTIEDIQETHQIEIMPRE